MRSGATCMPGVSALGRARRRERCSRPRCAARRRSRRQAPRPDVVVGELPAADRASSLERWARAPMIRRRRVRRTRGCAARPRRLEPGARRRVEPSRVGAGLWPSGGSAGPLGDRAWTPPTGFDRRCSADAPALVAIERALLQRSLERGELPGGAHVAVDLRAGGGRRVAARRRLSYRPGGRRDRRGPEPRGRAGVPAARGRRRAAARRASSRSGSGGADEVFLEVRESNRSAQALYAGTGSGRSGSGPPTTAIPREDALVLRLALERPGVSRYVGGVALVDGTSTRTASTLPGSTVVGPTSEPWRCM